MTVRAKRNTKRNSKSVEVSQIQQQGDVLLNQISSLPEGLTLLDTKVLQESETTGHHHQFLPDAPVKVYQKRTTDALEFLGEKFITPNWEKYIVVEDTCFLFHGKSFDFNPAASKRGDHMALLVEPGTYQVDIVREWDYKSQRSQRVID